MPARIDPERARTWVLYSPFRHRLRHGNSRSHPTEDVLDMEDPNLSREVLGRKPSGMVHGRHLRVCERDVKAIQLNNKKIHHEIPPFLELTIFHDFLLP